MNLTTSFIVDTHRQATDITYSLIDSLNKSKTIDKKVLLELTSTLLKLDNRKLRALSNPSEGPRYYTVIAQYTHRLHTMLINGRFLFTSESAQNLDNLIAKISEPSLQQNPAMYSSINPAFSIGEKQKSELEEKLHSGKFSNPEITEDIFQDQELCAALCEDLLEGKSSFSSMIPYSPPVGLKNKGNSCYRNASLQLLLSSPVFLEDCLRAGISESGRLFPILDRNILEQAKHKICLHNIIRRQLFHYHRALSQGSSYQLEWEDLNFVNVLVKSSLMPDLDEESRDLQQDVAAYLQVLLTDVFGIKINYRVTYTTELENIPQVKHASDQFPFLRVPITDDKGLQDSINLAHATKSITDEKNPINFEINGKEIPCTTYSSTTKIDGKEPDTLFLLVERRILDPVAGNYIYDDRPLSIPDNRIINMSQVFSSDNDRSINYEVVGVINYHIIFDDKNGESRGHYTAVVKREISQTRWFLVNDDLVIDIPQEEAVGNLETAYVLLLQKVENPRDDQDVTEPPMKIRKTHPLRGGII